MLIKITKTILLSTAIWGLSNYSYGAPNLDGQDGYIKMPNALTDQDGTWNWGYSFSRPYSAVWTSVSVLPFMQAGFRYVGIIGVNGFPGTQYANTYGRYKDKVFDVKFTLVPEGAYTPAIGYGREDVFGTDLWASDYLAMTKHIGPVEATIGYGDKQIDGAFAGLRWTPSAFPNWSLVTEYDAHDYQKDYQSSQTYASQRGKGISTGIEYRWGWLAAQVAHQKATNSINLMARIPLNEKEFVPKFQEPGYFAPVNLPVRPTAAQWLADSSYQLKLVEALRKQDYTLIHTSYRNGTLLLNLSNSRISDVGRSVGRAVRTALYFMPLETRTIKVTHTELDLPIVTYEFFDLPKLSDYLNGKLSRKEFNQFVLVRSGETSDRLISDDKEVDQVSGGIKEDLNYKLLANQDGDFVQLRGEDSWLNRVKVAPKLSFFFNDPSNAYGAQVKALATMDRRLANGLYFNGSAGVNLWDNISSNPKASNSLLPHVRSDIGEYIDGNRYKLYTSTLSQYFKPAPNWYGRVSAGIYEEMFAGSGGQLLYSPLGQRWSADVDVDVLKQRDVKGWFGFRPYNTVQALFSMHYRLPYGVTATARMGQFLAKDKGVRLEVSRRFRSGIEIGAWYTHTNGNDITSPGSPASPYQDKGVFFSIPLSTMLTMDNRSIGNFGISPWTRDGGQMVDNPGDLYWIVEDPRRVASQYDGLGNLSERADEAGLPVNTQPIERFDPWPSVKLRLDDSVTEFPSLTPLAQGSLSALGLIGLAALADKPWDTEMKKYQNQRLLKWWAKGAKYSPYISVGLSGVAMALGDDQLQNTGFIALQSVALATVANVGVKGLVNRARPGEGNSPWSTQTNNESRWSSSFASTHSVINFAAVTPFAEQYDAPWLYGAAAIASAGRTANRQHWLSDVVAGSIGGYAIGKWLWSAQRYSNKYQAMFNVGANSAGVSVKAAY